MGIGVNFICSCCSYDTGMLMLNQGINDDVPTVVGKYLDTYSNEIDVKMLPQRKKRYQHILSHLSRIGNISNYAYNYYGCICYRCSKTYEMLDILELKEEQVFAGEGGIRRAKMNPLYEMFHFPKEKWTSFLGDKHLCLFCRHYVVRITEERLAAGLDCPKCLSGTLKIGEEFQIWD